MKSQVSQGLLVLLIALTFSLSACGDKPRPAVGKLDTPGHHTLRGYDFIDEADWKQAERSFAWALSLDKTHSGALGGMAVVKAQHSSRPGLSADAREDLASEAEELAEDALKQAQNERKERSAHIVGIRIMRLSKYDKDWLENAEEHYEEALELDEQGQDPLPHFYMARAYRDGFELQKAQTLYSKVLGMNRAKTSQANTELALLQKIIRAEPGTVHGRNIAFSPSISRADMAALFLSELRLKRLFARHPTQKEGNNFKAPQQPKAFQTEVVKRVENTTDIKEHPLRGDIEEILKLRVVGLEPDPAHKFHPNAKVTRGEFAIMVEDILVKVTGEAKLKTRFIGSRSPFSDVGNTLPQFNAIQTVVSRGLMEPQNKVRGIFGLSEPVAGADALLAIRQIKSELQSYTRS